MNVKELIEKLKTFPDETVVLLLSLESEYDYTLLQSVSLKKIDFENKNGTVNKIAAIILDEQ